MKKPDQYIGKGYRCTDGVVRWVVERSQRGYYHALWLDETTGIWWQGGRWKAADLTTAIEGAEAFTPPQPGETYKRAGVFGGFTELTVR